MKDKKKSSACSTIFMKTNISMFFTIFEVIRLHCEENKHAKKYFWRNGFLSNIDAKLFMVGCFVFFVANKKFDVYWLCLVFNHCAHESLSTRCQNFELSTIILCQPIVVFMHSWFFFFELQNWPTLLAIKPWLECWLKNTRCNHHHVLSRTIDWTPSSQEGAGDIMVWANTAWSAPEGLWSALMGWLGE